MRITAVETIRFPEAGNLIWVRLHTDTGAIGLGETFRGAAAVEAVLHETIAPGLRDVDPFDVERLSRNMTRLYVGSRSSGAEIRAASAVDIALWDLFGQAKGEPVWRLLGGLAHDRMPTYNTCAGPRYNASGGWRRIGDDEKPLFRYDDQVAFTRDAGALARDLLAEGIGAMKIWPFDPAAVETGGGFISGQALEAGLAPVRAIRDSVGDAMDILIECHGLWEPAAARTIAAGLAPFNVVCMEDPIRLADPLALADLRRQIDVPVMASETLATRSQFLDHLRADAIDYAMLDVSWCGGLTEARKIAALADSFQRPVAPHDCTGPVVYMAALHLAFAVPNAVFQESVRAYYRGWYADMVTAVPSPDRNGFFQPPDGPGLGLAPTDAVLARDDLIRRTSPL